MIKIVLNAYKVSFSGLSRGTWLLAAVILINRCGYMAVPFMGLYVTQYLNRQPSDAGLIIMFFGLGSVVGAATGGYFTDKIGYKPVQIIALVTSGSLFLVFSTITHFPSLCLLALIISFFSEAFRPANFAATAVYANKGTETRSYSLNRLAINIGWAVGSSVGGMIASFNYHLLFIVDGTISIIAGICILLLLPMIKAKSEKNVSSTDKENETFNMPWQDPIFLRFVIITTVFAICFFLMFRVGPVFFKENWQISEAIIGIYLALNGIIIALLEMIIISWLEKKYNPLRNIMVGSCLLAFSFLLLSAHSSFVYVSALIAVVLFTAGEMFSLPFISSFVVSRTHEHNRGQYAAVYTL
ncbi:MAG: MFS transporter, partial [Chitinophagaceae bacterium]|nr:MFS transporter [Chitinophagaceae bacterium]